MSAFNGKAPYAPDYASYNWIGAPSDYSLSTNPDLGGDSRTCPTPLTDCCFAHGFPDRHRKLEQMVPIW